VVSYVGACAPDLVIHLGDLSLDGAGSAVDLRHGRTQLDRLPAPWHAVPGKHDIGDNPWPGAPAGIAAGARSQAVRDRVAHAHYRTPAQQELIEPDGLEQHTVTVDLPDPYHN
jgi:3',5'-cyclic AMP phosphodiesterase CpdA